MSLIPFWKDEAKTIVCLEVKGGEIKTWDDYHDAIDATYTLVKDEASMSDTIFFVVDADNARMPAGNPLPHLRRAMRVKPSQIRVVYNVVSNGFAASILSILARMVGIQQMKNVPSWDDIYDDIAQYRQRKQTT